MAAAILFLVMCASDDSIIYVGQVRFLYVFASHMLRANTSQRKRGGRGKYLINRWLGETV